LFPKEWVVVLVHDDWGTKVIDEFYFERTARNHAEDMNNTALRMGYNQMYVAGRREVIK